MISDKELNYLIVGDNLDNYLAKCHEAFRTGLRTVLGAECFGAGYPFYDGSIHDYGEIIRLAEKRWKTPDVVIADYSLDNGNLIFTFQHIKDINARKVILLADFWQVMDDIARDNFITSVMANGIDYIMSYFPHPLTIFKGTALDGRILYTPPCIDPLYFNNWHKDKKYDVGFLAANTLNYSSFYPERYEIHKKLQAHAGISYLWAEHPGWERRDAFHPLVGKGFSEQINSCRLFINTSGRLRHPNPKYVEIMASKTVMLAEEPYDEGRLGLKDGYNYVKITVDDVIEKVDFYLSRPDLCEQIATNAYETAMQKHSCFVRAAEFDIALKGLASVTPLARSVIPLDSGFKATEYLKNPTRPSPLPLPTPLLCDANQVEAISLPPTMSKMPISSSPQFTLYRLVRHLKPSRILEIGTQEGASAVAMAIAMAHNGTPVDITCIDPFLPCGDNYGDETFQAFSKNIGSTGLANGIRLLKSFSGLALGLLKEHNEAFDLILVDGSHKYEDVKSDFTLSLPLIRGGGYIWLHDYIYYEPVRRACDEVVVQHGMPFFINDLQRNYRNDLCGWMIVRPKS